MKYRDMKIKSKLLIGFCCVIVLSIILSGFSIYTLNKVNAGYENLLGFSQQRLKHVLEIKTNVMDIRRITTAINAYTGNVERQEGYKTESANIVNAINIEADSYIDLAKNDTSLSQEEARDIVSKADSLKTVLAEYKAKLIGPNIISAMANDKESVVANAAAQAPLISTLSETIQELTQYEENLTETLSDKVIAQEVFYSSILLIITVVIVALSLLAAFTIAGIITKPIKLMSNYFRYAGTTGDIRISPENLEHMKKISSGKDEVGEISASLAGFMERITAVSEALEMVANGDLTVELPLLSETDMMGASVQKMLNSLNDMFGEVNAVTDQVSGGSTQIADSTQALSQGASEQAAAVEELGTTIVHVLAQTQENAQNAQRTLSLVNQAGAEMQDTVKHMEELKSTMTGISLSSEKISKVIKVIDDIAFQTNILALNAAVEAARAGQHGKGFAVVADEVRNLASKSAEAAKETAELVQTSVGHVQRGSEMADKTAQSVIRVADTAQQAQEKILEINEASKAQEHAITQINEGIGQISQVVQTNSATAEENAAASEELSGQSQILRELVGRFKIIDSEYHSDFSPNSIPSGLLSERTQEPAFSLLETNRNNGKYIF